MSASWWCKTFLFVLLLKQRIRHPSTNRSASVGLGEYSTTRLRIWELSCPPVHLETGRGTNEPAPTPLTAAGKKTYRLLTWADTDGQEIMCRSLPFPRRYSSMPLEGKKKKSLVAVEIVRGIFPGPTPPPMLRQQCMGW